MVLFFYWRPTDRDIPVLIFHNILFKDILFGVFEAKHDVEGTEFDGIDYHRNKPSKTQGHDEILKASPTKR